MIKSLDHVQIAIPANRDDEARKYYSGVLELPELEKPEPLKPRGGCWFDLGNVGLHLGVEADFKAAKKAHPAFRVDNLEELSTKLLSFGYEVIWDENFPGEKRFYSYDVFGNRLEFMQSK